MYAYSNFSMKQVYHNIKKCCILYKDLEISTHLSICKLNTFHYLD